MQKAELINLPYHQPAFLHITRIFKYQIRDVLYFKFAAFRASLLLAHLPVGKILDGNDAWDHVRGVLDAIDGEMRTIASRRSVAYWLHIYRRIGVFLSPEHESKTDHTTVGLVRQIVELAIQKHGLSSASGEFGFSDMLSPEIILGGWMKKGLKSLGNKKMSGEQLFRRYAAILRSNPTWVIRDFSKRDLIDIYALEGAAYQYWRLTALLRSLGKGAKIILDETGDWHYVPDPALNRLIVSIDKRNEQRNTFSSLMGIWIDSETIMGREGGANGNEQSDIIFFPIYNTQRVVLPVGTEFYGARIPSGVTNFLPLYMRSKVFFQHHEFMRKEFLERRGYDFELLISVLAGLSSLTVIPSRTLLSCDKNEQERIKLSALMQTLTRGYHLFVGSEDDLLKMLMERMSIIFSMEFEKDKVRAVLSSISLNEGAKNSISLWSNGPRCVVIPAGTVCVVDLVSIPALLASIFVFMTDRFGESGTVFETLFKEALKRRGFDVYSGKLFANDGSERELDAGVLVGDRMYLFECVSIERPLDYEIGRPKTIAGRQKRLSKKLDQANSLQAFVSVNPSGRNYDFSQATEFVSVVVSPFVEWIWSAGPELWFDHKTPKILSPEEAISLVSVKAD